MGTQIILDRTGDTRHEFDTGDANAIQRASERFSELVGRGFLAYTPAKDGEPAAKVRAFDPDATTIFSPPLVGG